MKNIMKNKHIIFGVLAFLLLAVFLFLPQTAHAQNLHQDLTRDGSTQPWIFTTWAVMLGLADVIIVLVLLVIAIVNILHLQYDTYALKKSLPLLIGGIIASHFSILICRMIVDAAGVLENQFMGGNPRDFVQNLLCTIGIGNPVSGDMQFLFVGTGAAGIVLILLILVTLFFAIAIGVLSFLLWIRKTIIFLLVALSPIAFILYAFPPTQGLFKQWWTQFMQWVFMGPVMVAIMWMASQIGANPTGGGCPPFNLNAALVAGGLMFAAAIVPFKMGGAIMGAWSGFGKWATGTNKEGYLRKPIDKAIDDQKKAYKMRANNYINKNNVLGMGNRRASHEMEMATLEAEQKAFLQQREKDVRRNKGSHQGLREAEVANSQSILEEEKVKQQLDIESGNFNHISKKQIAKITGESDPMNAAQKYIEQANRLKQMQEGLEKRRDLDLQNLSVRDLRENSKFRQQIKGLGVQIDADYAEDGTKLAPGTARAKVGFDRALEIGEELRFKAKSETDATKREELIQAAKHYEEKAKEFQSAHTTDVSGNKIQYEAYLSRNLSGRRQKVLNPAIKGEADVQVLSSTHTGLVDDTMDPTKTFGTSEWRATKEDYDKALSGDMEHVDDTAAYACQVQIMATHQVMETARRGDVKGLETTELFCDRVASAGRTDFKSTTAELALSSMDTVNQAAMRSHIADQAGYGTNWGVLTPAQQQDALNKFNFKKMDVTSSGNSKEGKQASRNRAFIDRFLAQVELDDKLGLSKSPGTVIGKEAL